MPTAISCPTCRRVLNLPAEAMNRLVQCPACKHQFHPAEATPAENVRPIGPKIEAMPSSPAAMPAARAPDRRPAPPLPTAPAESNRSGGRRGKREVEDLCPACQAFVPRGLDHCPECRAEFEPEDDAGYRPWEQEGVERRDSEPHRGGLLLAIGIGSLITPVFFFFCYLGVVTSLVGLIGSIACCIMASNDLRKMREHVMNREGEGTTNGARICAAIGVLLNLFALPAAIYFTSIVF